MSDTNDRIELDPEERALFEERAQQLRAETAPSWKELQMRLVEPAPRSFMSVGIAATVATAAVLALAWSLSRPQLIAPQPAPAAVPSAPVQADEPAHDGAFMAAGYVAAKATISVSSPTGGVVMAVKVQVGEKITRGQLLVQLEHMAIKSPIDGVVLERLVNPGDGVTAYTALLKIADLTQLVAEVDIVEADIDKIHLGQLVEVTSEVDRSYDGTVYEIAAEVDKSRGTVLVKVQLRASYPSLRPGSAVKCAFLASSRAAASAPRPRVASSPPPGVSREPASAPQEPGYLVANTQPWARVFVDGKDTGQSTPIPPSRRLRLTPGRHTITFASDHKKLDYTVVVRQGEEIRLIKVLE